MKLTRKLAILLLAATLNVSVTAMSDQTENEIHATMSGLESALNKNNLNGLQSIYDDEATVFIEDATIRKDKSAILSFWDTRLNNGKNQYHIDVIDFRIKNDTAYLSASWSALVFTENSNVKVIDGYVSNVLKRQADGSWKIRMQNWN